MENRSTEFNSVASRTRSKARAAAAEQKFVRRMAVQAAAAGQAASYGRPGHIGARQAQPPPSALARAAAPKVCAAWREDAAQGTAGAPPGTPPAGREDSEVDLCAAQAMRIEIEDACVGQLHAMLGFRDELLPGDYKFLTVMKVVAPLFVRGVGEILTVEDAMAAFTSLLAELEGGRLHGEETPVARRAALRYIQSCM